MLIVSASNVSTTGGKSKSLQIAADLQSRLVIERAVAYYEQAKENENGNNTD